MLLKIIKDLFFLLNALFLRAVFRVAAVSFKISLQLLSTL